MSRSRRPLKRSRDFRAWQRRNLPRSLRQNREAEIARVDEKQTFAPAPPLEWYDEEQQLREIAEAAIWQAYLDDLHADDYVYEPEPFDDSFLDEHDRYSFDEVFS